MGDWKPSSSTFNELNDHLEDGRWQQAESVARNIYQHYYKLNSFPPDSFTEKQNTGIRLAAKAHHVLPKDIKDRTKNK